jgi:hypothetical protein
MDDFKFFDKEWDDLPELTRLDKFCLTLCGLAFVGSLIVAAVGF